MFPFSSTSQSFVFFLFIIYIARCNYFFKIVHHGSTLNCGLEKNEAKLYYIEMNEVENKASLRIADYGTLMILNVGSSQRYNMINDDHNAAHVKVDNALYNHDSCYKFENASIRTSFQIFPSFDSPPKLEELSAICDYCSNRISASYCRDTSLGGLILPIKNLNILSTCQELNSFWYRIIGPNVECGGIGFADSLDNCNNGVFVHEVYQVTPDTCKYIRKNDKVRFANMKYNLESCHRLSKTGFQDIMKEEDMKRFNPLPLWYKVTVFRNSQSCSTTNVSNTEILWIQENEKYKVDDYEMKFNSTSKSLTLNEGIEAGMHSQSCYYHDTLSFRVSRDSFHVPPTVRFKAICNYPCTSAADCSDPTLPFNKNMPLRRTCVKLPGGGDQHYRLAGPPIGCGAIGIAESRAKCEQGLFTYMYYNHSKETCNYIPQPGYGQVPSIIFAEFFIDDYSRNLCDVDSVSFTGIPTLAPPEEPLFEDQVTEAPTNLSNYITPMVKVTSTKPEYISNGVYPALTSFFSLLLLVILH